MSKLTLAQLIELLRGEGNPPPGFVNVPPEHVYSDIDSSLARIDYSVFYNAATNQLIVSGAARPQPLGGDGMGGSPTVSVAGIFSIQPSERAVCTHDMQSKDRVEL